SPIQIPDTDARPHTVRATPKRASKRGLVIAISLLAAGGIAAAIIFTQRQGKPAPVAVLDAPPVPDASVVRRNDPARRDQLIGECEQLAADRKWPELGECGRKLDELDPIAAKAYLKLARNAGAPPITPTPTNPGDQPLPEGCDDAENLEAAGDKALASGSFSAAYDSLDKAFECKPSVLPKIYLAACRARHFERAKELFQKFPVAKRAEMARICLKDGFDPAK
ncbi:MAG: hypothetical protein H0V17_02170, partial [Deltaproteobacteria bacterium]|nr:hypothetical protein [Deltaproteobacteria bacterium]